jgi:uncharacterized protein (UPF0261 family)
MIPLLSLRLGAGFAHEAVAPAEVAKFMVSVLDAAKVAGDVDVFHVCIVAQRGECATINLQNRIVLSPYIPRV